MWYISNVGQVVVEFLVELELPLRMAKARKTLASTS